MERLALFNAEVLPERRTHMKKGVYGALSRHPRQHPLRQGCCGGGTCGVPRPAMVIVTWCGDAGTRSCAGRAEPGGPSRMGKPGGASRAAARLPVPAPPPSGDRPAPGAGMPRSVRSQPGWSTGLKWTGAHP
ncbi:hypothetical protein GCM10010378_30830 [Streptomyces viridochromogenes]